MRFAILLPMVVLVLAAVVRAAEDRTRFRAPPPVHSDPPAWYSATHFRLMGKPLPGQWMAAHPEPAQSFEQYVAAKPPVPTVGRHTLYLSPLGKMTEKDLSRLATLREYLETYYTLPVRMAPAAGLDGVTSRDRAMFGRTVRQYLAGDILYQVLRPNLPRDAMCLLGVAMEDLYPEPSWNYVFGQASLSERVGVYSLVRFYPAFWGNKDDEMSDWRGLKRSLATLVHETGHMFGVAHCQKYECVMNGSNSLEESDLRPLYVCPECLRKFRWSIGFDIVTRYEALKTFYEKNKMAAEAAWVDSRLRECRGAAGATATPAATTKPGPAQAEPAGPKK
jgi:archaemetzincin